MNVLISGSSGLIGSALCDYLRQRGHHVIPLLRRRGGAPCWWLPDRGEITIDPGLRLDAVINLAGPGVADRRWTAARKKLILEARVNGTSLLARELARREQKPAAFLSASAIGFYGDRGATLVDEGSEPGHGFLAEVARQWEQAATPAALAGIRSVLLRTGIVLDAQGGALQRLLLPFRLGLGGVVGSGQQYMSWIGMLDLLRAIEFLLLREELAGPFNLVAPAPVSNREFTRVLARVLRRPALVPLPGVLAKLVFGEMARELLLEGVRVSPARLLKAGFQFRQPQLEQALRDTIYPGARPSSGSNGGVK